MTSTGGRLDEADERCQYDEMRYKVRENIDRTRQQKDLCLNMRNGVDRRLQQENMTETHN
jgi:hypothetical protein